MTHRQGRRLSSILLDGIEADQPKTTNFFWRRLKRNVPVSKKVKRNLAWVLSYHCSPPLQLNVHISISHALPVIVYICTYIRYLLFQIHLWRRNMENVLNIDQGSERWGWYWYVGWVGGGCRRNYNKHHLLSDYCILYILQSFIFWGNFLPIYYHAQIESAYSTRFLGRIFISK